MKIFPGAIAEAGSGFVGTVDNIPGVTLKVLSAGTISGGAALAGDLVEVLSGGLVSGLTVSGGATEIVSARRQRHRTRRYRAAAP